MPLNPADADLVNRIAATQMGVAAPAAPAAATAAPPAPPAKLETPAEKAQSQAAPKDEGDKGEEAPIAFEVDFNGEKRKLNPNQIRSTFERYAALNNEHAELKPIHDMARHLMKESGAPAGELAKFMMTAMQAMAHNPTMGQRSGNQEGVTAPNTPEHAGDPDEELSRWEQENAATLPPGYKDIRKNMSSIERMLMQQQELLTQVLQAGRGQVDAAAAAHQDARAQTNAAAKARIAHNLNQAQQHFGLPDEAANDFLTFAYERGFTIEDFINPDMALRVVSDFKNAMATPELERIKAIAQKRQSFTGSLGSAPTSAPAAPAQGDPMFDKMAQAAMARRFG